MDFIDHPPLSADEAHAVYRERYPHLQFVGKSHGQIQRIRHLYKNTKPNPEKLCPIEGVWGAEQLIELGIAPEILLICPEYLYTAKAQQIVDQLQKTSAHFYAVSKKVFDLVKEDPAAGGILVVFPFPTTPLIALPLKESMRLVVLDGVEIQGNAGTIARSADATAFDAVIFTHRKIRLNHPKFIRASMGSVLRVPIIEADVEELAAWLHQNGFQILLADTEGATVYHKQEYAKRCCLVVGSEKYGLHKDWYGIGAQSVCIPMLGSVDSLNVAIAATVLMYESVFHSHSVESRENFLE